MIDHIIKSTGNILDIEFQALMQSAKTSSRRPTNAQSVVWLKSKNAFNNDFQPQRKTSNIHPYTKDRRELGTRIPTTKKHE